MKVRLLVDTLYEYMYYVCYTKHYKISFPPLLDSDYHIFPLSIDIILVKFEMNLKKYIKLQDI